MYHTGTNTDNGSRVEINSGFPIKASNNSVDYYGYIGYHGLWMPTEAGVADNSTVYKLDFSGGSDQTGTSYTVRSWGGKLIKYTKNTITLGSIKNIPLNWYDNSAGYEKRVFWNGTNFTVDAYRNSSTDWQWADMTTTTFTLNASNAEHGFHFYSQALGGDGQIVLVYSTSTRGGGPTQQPTDASSVIFNTQEPVFPGDSVPTTLACYENCLNPDTIATGSDSWGASSSIYLSNKWLGWDNSANAWAMGSGRHDNASAADPYIYTWDNTTSGMVLQYDNGTKTNVLLGSANSNLSWGARSGILFDNSTAANFTALQCSWDNSKICPHKARGGLSTYYVWQTGPEAWDKLTVLVDSDNSSAKFDPPMVVKYTHGDNKSNSGKNYENAAFYLEYGGHGDLWGVPSFCVDAKTGAKVSCANDGSTRWVPEFMIKKASLVTQVKDGSTQYLVKPLQVEQTMRKTSSTSVCADAGLSLGGVSLPDSEPYSDPDIGERPTVEGPPAVVAGAKM